MQINRELLEKTCKNTIEVILSCLECATMGTIYMIGPMPGLKAERVTSGISDAGQISWGLPEDSDYNSPGKEWEQYLTLPVICWRRWDGVSSNRKAGQPTLPWKTFAASESSSQAKWKTATIWSRSWSERRGPLRR